ncbi:MAG TPA: AMP-binding protein [Acidimicrobiales bacterium]
MAVVDASAHPAALHQQPLMPDLLIAALNRNLDKPAVYLGETVLTARQVRDEISRYMQALESKGLGRGSPVAVLALNRPEVLFNMGAGMLTGCRTTPLHPMGSLDDHAYVLEDAGIETLVYDPQYFGERAAALAERVPGLKNLLAFGPTEAEGAHDYIALASGFEPRPLRAPDVAADDIPGLAYTGGTTGKPKGVMGSYRSGATMTQIQMTEWEWPPEPRFLMCTPLSHAGAAFFVPVLLLGGSLVVVPYFEPGLVLETIERERITATMLVPTMLYMLMDHPDFATRDLSSLETVYYGAAAMSPTRLREAIGKLGPIFFQYYGQAEGPMTLCVLRKDEHDVDDLDRLATCGRPVPWVHVRLLDDDCNEVPRGEPGEICVRGPLVMRGYWNKPEQTAEALAGGWLHTGDIAREDEDGFYTIVDRKKDMIVTGGFNVFPREVEDVISAHPAVANVAVIGVPDDRWGEAVKAVVVLRPGASAEAAELIDAVKAAKGSIQAPKSVDFADEIPLSPLGKPDKKALRARYWEGTDRQVN